MWDYVFNISLKTKEHTYVFVEFISKLTVCPSRSQNEQERSNKE